MSSTILDAAAASSLCFFFATLVRLLVITFLKFPVKLNLDYIVLNLELSRVAWSRSTTTTVWPTAADTWAIPDPIWPPPIMATFLHTQTLIQDEMMIVRKKRPANLTLPCSKQNDRHCRDCNDFGIESKYRFKEEDI